MAENAERLCPDCGQFLTPQTYDGVQIDSCLACGGIWFDDGELRKLQKLDSVATTALEERCLAHAQLQPHLQGDRRCPICERVLDRYHYTYDSPVELDACGSCNGIWVQDGELQKIEEYLSQQRGAPSERERIALAVADMAAAHEAEMSRLRRLHSFSRLLYRRPLPWWA